MTEQLLWTRYHRYDSDGNKHIKRFETHEDPTNIVEEGYTQWCRGTGKLSPEQYENVVNAIRKSCKGVPKSEEHKKKMSLAKLGKPKSLEHRKNMSKAWEKRRIGGMPEEHRKKISLAHKKHKQNKYQTAMAQLEQLRQGNQ